MKKMDEGKNTAVDRSITDQILDMEKTIEEIEKDDQAHEAELALDNNFSERLLAFQDRLAKQLAKKKYRI